MGVLVFDGEGLDGGPEPGGGPGVVGGPGLPERVGRGFGRREIFNLQ